MRRTLFELYSKPSSRYLDIYTKDAAIKRIFGWNIYDQNLEIVDITKYSDESVVSMHEKVNKTGSDQ